MNVSPSVDVWLPALYWFAINSEREGVCWHLVPKTEIMKSHYPFINTLPAVIIWCRTVKLPLCVSSQKHGRAREGDSCHLFVPLTLSLTHRIRKSLLSSVMCLHLHVTGPKQVTSPVPTKLADLDSLIYTIYSNFRVVWATLSVTICKSY
jgi:hypothetical protein